MERWSLNNRFISVDHYPTEEDIRESIFHKINERSGFGYNEQNVIIPRHFIRIIGVENEEADYYNYLFDFKEKLSSLNNLFLFINEGFDSVLPSKMKLELDRGWSELIFDRNITPNSIYQKLEERKLIAEFPNKTMSHQVRKTLMDMLKYYIENKRIKVANEELKTFVYQFCLWIDTYAKNLFLEYDYTYLNPKVLYYGDITENEVLFLSYLSLLGCDILYFNPEYEHFFGVHAGGLSQKIEFNRKVKKKPFPNKRIVGRASTLTYEASQEINEMLSNGNGFYRNWALIDFPTHAVTLRTTYDEIFRISPEVAQVRPEWNVQRGMVNIPNIFAKVSGITEDENDYWDKIKTLTSGEQSLFFNDQPIIAGLSKSITYYLDLLLSVSPNGVFNHELLLDSPKWPYSKVQTGMQKNLALEIQELINNNEVSITRHIDKNMVMQVLTSTEPNVKQVLATMGVNNLNAGNMAEQIVHKHNSGLNFNVGGFNQNSLNNAYVLGACLELPIEFLRMIQTFDYPKFVPKLVLYTNGNREFTFEETVIVRLMSRMCFDVIIYNPSGKNDIELYIDPTLQIYDVHLLENRKFDLSYKNNNKKERGVWFSRFFN